MRLLGMLRPSVLILSIICLAGCGTVRPHPTYAVDSEARAIELSDAFVSAHGRTWGKSVRVDDVPAQDRYVVIYSTPPEERMQIGERGVYVSKIDGSTMFMPRL